MSVASVANRADGRVSGLILRAFELSRVLRRACQATFTLHDRVLHPSRHLDVVRRLANAPRPRRILIVCHGNICRSPYLQAVLQRSLPDVLVASAGFVGSDRSVPQISVSLSAKRGLDLSRHLSRPITQEEIADADLVIAMEPKQARRIARTFNAKRERIVIAGDLEPTFETSRAIRDPWNRSIEVFVESFDRLDRCADTLVSVLQPNRAGRFEGGNR